MSVFTKLAVAVGVMLLYQIITYFGCEIFQKDPHNVLTDADEHIPFLPATCLIYSLWFPLIALFPIAAFYAQAYLFAVYMTAMVVDITASVIIYMIYPTSFVRPVPPDTPSGRLMKLIYKGSFRGLNCAPSLHCSSCMLIILSCVSCNLLAGWIRIVCIAVSAGIIVSTMTTKQHALKDFLTAIPMAVICWIIGCMMPAVSLTAWILR